jgi:hypothetical protein
VNSREEVHAALRAGGNGEDAGFLGVARGADCGLRAGAGPWLQ